MKRKLTQLFCSVVLALLLPVSAFAAQLDAAARKAAKENDAKVLSAKTTKQAGGRTHEIKMLTKKGVVKTVKVPEKRKKKKDR